MIKAAWGLVLSLAVSFAFAENRGVYSVLQGASDEQSVQLTVVHKKSEKLNFFALIGNQEYVPVTKEIAQRDFSDTAVTWMQFENLPKGFKAQFLIKNEEGRVLDRRPFHGLAKDPQQSRVAFVSCAAGYLYHQDIWLQFNNSNPDLVLFLGDNIYGDRPNVITKKPATPEQLWRLYVEGRALYDFYFRHELVPAIAIWDDHDFGTDDANETYPYAAESEAIFLSFFAQKATRNFARGPGVASYFTAFGMDFAMLDGRRFRTPETGPGAQVWGDAQLRWVNQKINSSLRPLWLVDGESFFGGYDEHSTNSDFPGDSERLVAMIHANPRAVGFLSGDLHFSEISDLEPSLLGYPSVEITSSSIHSITLPFFYKTWPNPRRRDATAEHNFVVLDIEPRPNGVIGRAISYNRFGQILFNQPIAFGRFQNSAKHRTSSSLAD